MELKVASQCSSVDVNTFSNYMAHSMEKHKKAYERIDTSEGAAKAHKLVRKLKEKKTQSSKE